MTTKKITHKKGLKLEEIIRCWITWKLMIMKYICYLRQVKLKQNLKSPSACVVSI